MNSHTEGTNSLRGIVNPEKKPRIKKNGSFNDQMIRFEERREQHLWVNCDEIIFVKSADHYVKSLIVHGDQKKWVTRHCTIKDLLNHLSSDNFIRLNRFYLFNRNYFSHIIEKEKKLFIDAVTFIDIPHRISPFIVGLLKDKNT